MNVDTVNTVVVLLLGLGAIVAGAWRGFTTLRRTLDRIEGVTQKELTTNGGKSLIDKVNTLNEQVGTVTEDVSGVKEQVRGVRNDLTSQHRELTEHIEDVRSKAAKLERDAENTAAAWIKYVFEHRRDHNELHQWLREEYGLDRRREGAAEEPPMGPTGPERREQGD